MKTQDYSERENTLKEYIERHPNLFNIRCTFEPLYAFRQARKINPLTHGEKREECFKYAVFVTAMQSCLYPSIVLATHTIATGLAEILN